MTISTDQPTHRIRLRGPWEYQVLARTRLIGPRESTDEPGSVPSPGKVVMPSDWGETLGRDFFGRVAFIRSFHQPTGLIAADRVDLVIDDFDAWCVVKMNGETLLEMREPTPRPLRFDVTKRLLLRNQLIVVVELPRETDDFRLDRTARHNLPGGLVGEVRLEIFSNAGKTTALSST